MITEVWCCNACDAEFDVERNGEIKHTCPQCGSRRTERVYVNGGAQFHGEGFTKASEEPRDE